MGRAIGLMSIILEICSVIIFGWLWFHGQYTEAKQLGGSLMICGTGCEFISLTSL